MNALALPGVDTLPPERLRQKALSQWFTPAPHAARLVAWCGDVLADVARTGDGIVLEPSAGHGALVHAIRERSDLVRIDACEIDPRFRSRLVGERVRVEIGDYLTRPAPEEPYAVGISNPPYEGGMDGAFLEKLMSECDRVVALIRIAALTGKDRHQRVWSRVDGHRDGWWMPGLAFLVSRPSFLAAGEATDSPLSDFVAVKLSRIGEPRPTAVEWWT